MNSGLAYRLNVLETGQNEAVMSAMKNQPNNRICLVPRVSGVGGMVTFVHKLSSDLRGRGYSICNDLADHPYSAVLVIGGTRQLTGLWRARRQGIRVIQRLDGINWLHRVRPPGASRSTGYRHFVRAEYGNRLLSFIRSNLASYVIYQSHFARQWWERIYGTTSHPNRVVYNGVDLQDFTPQGRQRPPSDRYRLLMIEGNLMGGYEIGLEMGVGLARALSERLRQGQAGLKSKPVELMVVGRVDEKLRSRYQSTSDTTIQWVGSVNWEQIPGLVRSAHLLYSADINPACPNSVIEALACGLPVLAFATGALPEMVTGDAGRLAPYAGNPWRLDPPDIPGLTAGAIEILQRQTIFRRQARVRAENAFSLNQMVEGYLEALLG